MEYVASTDILFVRCVKFKEEMHTVYCSSRCEHAKRDALEKINSVMRLHIRNAITEFNCSQMRPKKHERHESL
ncbi:hypothetical protein TSAR_011496 [Trichomalopsis sarcophagae]|uniref:Uncharacterized protein n=1 Tax=Trichomalopsis sarcophagae TaxID=543379 RepID=A0A232FJN9_9HYME|nr:hypothetical protein TSAR_011496 [Trichomalopsis sarcophagae]